MVEHRNPNSCPHLKISIWRTLVFFSGIADFWSRARAPVSLAIVCICINNMHYESLELLLLFLTTYSFVVLLFSSVK